MESTLLRRNAVVGMRVVAYVEPNAMAAFESTRRWPDGTQIVNEFSALKTGAGCNPGTV
jgi:hypothetical protein